MVQFYQLDAALLTHPGRKRGNNEDFVTHFEPDNPADLLSSGCLYLVADGVGGEALGERASRYAVQKVLYEYYRLELEPGERLRQAMQQANRDIYGYAEQNDRPIRMATTLVAAAIRGDALTVASVGDSRAYLIRDGRAQQVTRDHNLVGEMVRDGTLTEEEALRSEVKNRLTRSLGGEPEVHVDVFANIPLQPGDKILLCSDGLTRYALSSDFEHLTAQGSSEEITARLIDFANQHGGADNVSAVCIAIGQPVSIAEAAHRKVSVPYPTPVDWDTVVTQMPVYPQRRVRRPIIPRKYQSVIVIGVMLSIVAMTVVAGIRYLGGWGQRSGGSVPTLITPHLNVANIPPLHTFTPSPTFTEVTTATNTPTATETPTQTPEVHGICQYTVAYGDGYLKVIERFSDQVKCASLPSNTLCTLQDPGNKFWVGWVLEFSNVLPSECKANGGDLPNPIAPPLDIEAPTVALTPQT